LGSTTPTPKPNHPYCKKTRSMALNTAFNRRRTKYKKYFWSDFNLMQNRWITNVWAFLHSAQATIQLDKAWTISQLDRTTFILWKASIMKTSV